MKTLSINAFIAILWIMSAPLAAASSCSQAFGEQVLKGDGDPKQIILNLSLQFPEIDSLVQSTLKEVQKRGIKVRFAEEAEFSNTTSFARDEIILDPRYRSRDFRDQIKLLALIRHELVHTEKLPTEQMGKEHDEFIKSMGAYLAFEEVRAFCEQIDTLMRASKHAGIEPLSLVPKDLLPLVKILLDKKMPEEDRFMLLQIKIAQIEPNAHGGSYEHLWNRLAQDLWADQ